MSRGGQDLNTQANPLDVAADGAMATWWEATG